MNCEHWGDCWIKNGGCCSLNLYGGKPSLGICGKCKSYSGPDDRGIRVDAFARSIPLAGDVLEAAFKRVGIKRFVMWWNKQVGRSCNCHRTRQRINEIDRKVRKWLGMNG